MDLLSPTTHPEVWISGIIRDILQNSQEYVLKEGVKEKIWGEPLVGFSRGDDPLYREFKENIGEDYLLPLDIMQNAYPEISINVGDLTIISWILPTNNLIKEDNRRETRYPSESWARARVYGEEVNQNIRQSLVYSLKQAGYPSVSPLLSPMYAVTKLQDYPCSSLWSERHAAYASGLGTFGLCDGLITPVGKAMRCGSVITLLSIPPSVRNYSARNEYCPFFTDNSCGMCIDRCPAGAISHLGHDKIACAAYLQNTTVPFLTKKYGISTNSCGLCQTGVPCESCIPKR